MKNYHQEGEDHANEVDTGVYKPLMSILHSLTSIYVLIHMSSQYVNYLTAYSVLWIRMDHWMPAVNVIEKMVYIVSG